MRAHLYLLAGLMIAGAGLACDSPSSSDADPRLACLYLGSGTCRPDEPDESTCGYRTETQTTWGAECKGDAPACFRDDHFTELFPEGLYIGCGEYTANVLTAEAVEAALATTGSPRPLLKSEAVAYDGAGDPVVGTALFGEVVALSLNVGFDTVPGFTDGEPAAPLGELVLASGPCAGMDVAHVLDEANLVLGGCPSALTPANAAACVTAINNSFVQPANTCDDRKKKHQKDDDCEQAPVCSDLFESP
ncbi:MAG TPA: hypothetical protein VGB85_33030 [Nannocystis sp.]|jgi:hypothetical protein